VQQGIDVTVIAPGTPKSAVREQLEGVEVQRAKYWIPKWQGLANDLSGIMPNIKERPSLALQIPTLIAALTWRAVRLARSFDLVHAHWLYPAGIAGLVTAKARSIPLVVTSHGGDLNLARTSSVLTLLSRQISRASNKCIGVSHNLCEQFLSFGVPSKDVTFIPYGVDIDNDSALSASDHIPEFKAFRGYSGFRILYIGSLNERKSVETLVDACDQLKKGSRNIMCVVIGSGPTKEVLQNKVRENSLKGIVFMDPIAPSCVSSWMSAADVLILPSVSEGRPVVVLEAMAMGLPVIATDIPGTRELVQNLKTGLLFEPGNTKQLVQSVEKLIEDETLRKKMSVQAKSSVMSNGLTTPQISQKHIALYERLIGLKNNRPDRL
jgi:glycosyltransferase involved in cell wall biosynthesis